MKDSALNSSVLICSSMILHPGFLMAICLWFSINQIDAQEFNKTTKAVASDRESGDFFGFSVSTDADFTIVGAYGESEDANGNNALYNAGSAYIFELNNGIWNQVAKLAASDRGPSDYFGFSVSISGNYAIIGAPEEKEDTSGGNTMAGAGSAYIFERDSSGDWSEVQKITASDRWNGDHFSSTVSISGNVAVVGAYFESEDPAGGNSLGWAGSAYIFERDSSGIWQQTQKIVASDRNSEVYFGCSVAISGNKIVVGSYSEYRDTSGGAFAWDAGSAYIFSKDSTGYWSEEQKIVASDREEYDRFGYAVAIDGRNIAVGAYQEDENIFGTDSLEMAGSVYIFEEDSLGNWNEIQKIVASDRDADDLFGYSVSIRGENLLVGAYQEDDNISGIDSLESAGSAYLFKQDSIGIWSEIQKLVAPDREADDNFGYSVAVNQSYGIVGAYLEDEDESGMNHQAESGAIYILESCVISYANITDTTCGIYTSPSGNYSWDASGVYFDTVLNTNGCDSIIAVNLTVNNVAYGTLSSIACDSFQAPSGNYVWSESGIYSDTIIAVTGCDSIISIDLTINKSTTGIISETTCNSYESPSGNYAWDSTGVYTDTIPNAVGCDSIITIDLIINSIDTFVIQNGSTLSANSPTGNYQWLDCGNNNLSIIGATDQSFSPTENGSYALMIIDNNCIDTSSCYIFSSIGIEQSLSKSGFLIFPNPNHGRFNVFIDNSNVSPCLLTITTSLGKLVATRSITGNGLHDISLSGIAEGIYLISIHQEGSIFRERMIIH